MIGRGSWLIEPCVIGILNGLSVITISVHSKVPRGFPRCELLSVGTNGSHNYSVDPIKLLDWLRKANARAAQRSAQKET